MSVSLKLATSLDGRIATGTGESRWITGIEARQQVHRLRAEHDAVVVGVETALADDPELTVRLAGFNGPQPARVVLDSRQRLADGCKLITTARDIPTYLISITPPEARDSACCRSSRLSACTGVCRIRSRQLAKVENN